MAQLSEAILRQLQAADPKKGSVPPALPAVTGQPTDVTDVAEQTITHGMGQSQDVLTPAPASGGLPLNDAESAIAQMRQLDAMNRRMKMLASQPGRVLQGEAMIAGDPAGMAQLGYEEGEPTSNYLNWVGKALQPGISALEAVGSNIDRGRQAIAATANSLAAGNQWDRALQDGLISNKYWFHNPNYTSWRNVLETAGEPEGWKYNLWGDTNVSSRDIKGTMLDFAIDPGNAIGIGAKKGAELLAKTGHYLNPVGREVLGNMAKAGRLAHPDFHRWLEYIGRPDLAEAAAKYAPEFEKMVDNPKLVRAIKGSNPNIAKIAADIDDTIVKAARDGKLTMPHPEDPIRKIHLADMDQFVRAKMSDKLADLLMAHPEMAKDLTDKGGLKVFGQTVIPGRTVANTAKSIAKDVIDTSAENLEKLGKAVEGMSSGLATRKVGEFIQKLPDIAEGMGETVGKALSTVWGLPKPFARFLQANFYSRFKGVESQFRRQLYDIFANTSYADRVAITKAIDAGEIDKLLASTPRLQGPIEQMRHTMDELFAEESARGLIDPESKADNYIYHYYRNPRKAKAILTKRGLIPSAGSLDPSLYQRRYRTLAEAEADGLTPEYDAARLMAMRLLNGWRSIIAHDFYLGTTEKFGYLEQIRDGLKIAAKAEGENGAKVVEPLAQSILKGRIPLTDPTTGWLIGNQLAIEGKTPVEVIKILPDDVKRHFFRDRFAIAARRGGAKEIEVVKAKYGSYKKHWPTGEAGSLLDDTFNLAKVNRFDGPHVPVEIPKVGTAVLPERIAKKLQEVMNTNVWNSPAGDAPRGLFSMYDRILLNPFRKINTVIWPSFQFRNAYTNIIQSGMDLGLSVMNPATRYETTGILRGWKDLRLTTKAGERLTGPQVMDEFIRYGGMNTFYKRAQITTTGAATALADDVVKDLSRVPLINPFIHPVNSMQNLGTTIENEARLFHYWSLRKDGLSAPAAMERVHKFLFDYDNITPADRELFRRLFPFWTWMKKNTALQAEMAFRKPSTIANYQKIFKALQSDKDNPEKGYLERDLMPEYLRNEWGIRIGQGQQPQVVKYLLGLDLPANDLNTIWAGDMSKTVNRLASSTGPVSTIGEALFAWAGGDNDLAKGIDSGQPTYLALKYIKENPAAAPIVKWANITDGFDNQGRSIIKADPSKMKSLAVLSLMDRPLREISRFVEPQRDSIVSALARYLTGARFVEVNPGQLERAKYDEGTTRIDKWLSTLQNQAQSLYIKEGISPEESPFNWGEPASPVPGELNDEGTE